MKYLSFIILILAFSLNAKEPVTSQLILKGHKSWDNNALRKYPSGKPEITILEIKIAPNSEVKMHKHPVISAAIVMEGELTITTRGKKSINVKKGDSFLEVVDRFHYAVNKSNKPVKLLVFYVGEKNKPLTILK